LWVFNGTSYRAIFSYIFRQIKAVTHSLNRPQDELEAELNELEAESELAEQEELDRQLLNVGPSAADALPDVPAADPAKGPIVPNSISAKNVSDKISS
jgi:hypothetical protein